MTDTEKLTFFTEMEQDKNIRIGVGPLVGKVSNKLYSHKGGWVAMIVDQLKTVGYENSEGIYDAKKSWDDYDVVLIEHGMEYKGTFNVFGGSSDELADQVLRLFTTARLYSLHVDMPDIGEFVRTRMRAGTPYFKTLEARLEEFTEKSKSVKRADFIDKTYGQVFGDSHSFSLYQPGYTCTRHDGLTMHGMLTRGIRNYVFPWTKVLKVYIGNIDIRHHLMRQPDPLASIDSMINELEKQLKDLQLGSNVTVRHVLPIEDESRKIPSTGFYKKLPFFGSRAERAALSTYMNAKIDEMCSRNGWDSYPNPDCYFDEIGALRFDVMERPQSVHISREYHFWDYENRERNKKIL